MKLAYRAATFLVDPADPELAGNRAASARQLPNCRIYGCETSANGEILISGTADAIALSTDGTIDVVIDWKSDVELDAGKLNAYLDQLEAYPQRHRCLARSGSADDEWKVFELSDSP